MLENSTYGDIVLSTFLYSFIIFCIHFHSIGIAIHVLPKSLSLSLSLYLFLFL